MAMTCKLGMVVAATACIGSFVLLSGCDSSAASEPSGTESSKQQQSAIATSTTGNSTLAGSNPPTTTPPVTTPPVTTPVPPTSTLVTNYTDGDACLAAAMPASSTLFGSAKKVFAHYFSPFPISVDNASPGADYYNRNYLSPAGEADKWLKQGGYLRQRPLGTKPGPAATWQALNMESDVRAAIARGITGFTFDVLSVTDATDSDGALRHMLAAAQAVDSRFKIVVMPDLSTLGSNSADVVDIIIAAASSPAAYRLSDGRLVVSAFEANLNSPAWWQSVLSQLAAQGIKVAFVPTFMGWDNYAASFNSISYGFADWGTATAEGGSSVIDDAQTAHTKYSKIFMTPIDGQQFRPKDFLFWEAGNSEAFRNAWNSSIQGDADWVQLVTWNDYSESSQIAPYTDSTLQRNIGTGYYDLNGYYAAWFLTGQQPAITHDVLYYFYRREPTKSAAASQSQTDNVASGTAEDNIEVVAFLTAPGVISITIDGQTYTQNAPAGITSFKTATHPGVPLFTLSRNGADVFSFNGGIQIYGSAGLPSHVQDLTYWSGSAAKVGICAI